MLSVRRIDPHETPRPSATRGLQEARGRLRATRLASRGFPARALSLH